MTILRLRKEALRTHHLHISLFPFFFIRISLVVNKHFVLVDRPERGGE